jgi:Zn-dependent protease with chaperone function
VASTPVAALYYDGRQSRAQPVSLTLSSAGAPRFTVSGAGFTDEMALAEVRIDDRVGESPRFLHLPRGVTIEITDNAAFDAALVAVGAPDPARSLRLLERRWSYAVLAVIALIAASWAFITYAVPALAARAVDVIPPQWDARIGAEGLELLDRAVLEPSTLARARQDELERLFASVRPEAVVASVPYRLEFRGGGAIGANALALPSGIVVLTDELQALARHDDELRAVFAHEVGHIEHRHAMRRLVQSSATALLVMGLFGDVSGVSSLAATLPTVLIEAAYSRDFEREADDYAYRWMREHNVAPERLGDLLTRLAAEDGEEGSDYLSSHPQLAERVQRGRDSRTP